MRRTVGFLAGILLSCSTVLCCGAVEVTPQLDWQKFMSRHDPVWDRLTPNWHEGAFVGNGLLGTMIYGEGKDGKGGVRFDIGRSDVTDHRDGADPLACRPRLPIGRYVLKPVGAVQSQAMRLDLWNAEATGQLVTDRGQIRFRAFVHTTAPVIVVELKAMGDEVGCGFEFIPEVSESPRFHNNRKPAPAGYKPNPPAVKETPTAGTTITVQPFLAGGSYATVDRLVAAGSHRTVFISVGLSFKDDSAKRQAFEAIDEAVKIGVPALEISHRDWWHGFYPASFISIPDTRLESFYWIQIYKLASATRADRPAIDLMGPWFRDTGWPAIWWNLNIQLTYWPVYASNHLELGESLTRMMDRGVENLIKNVKAEYREDSAGVGRVSSYDCQGSIGGEMGNLPWACHNYWLQYRYSMDQTMLRDRLYPLLRRSINYYLHHVSKAEDGKYHLPPSVSPEYQDAPLPDCNYDLAIFRWGCQTLVQICERLKVDDPLLPRWKEVLANLVEPPTDANGLMIGRGVPFAKSHRHYSHLFVMFPLFVWTPDQPDHRAVIEKSIDHWLALTGGHAGYTYTGAASMYAALGRGDDAVKWLNTCLDKVVKPNTMYLEGSPVIETPLSAARSLQDMLLQSWGERIRVFPGVPAAWKDVTFHNLRAEGAFLVSASRKDGKTHFVRITSLAGEPCRVKTDLAVPVRVQADRPVKMKLLADNVVELDLKRGDTAVLYSGDIKPPLVLLPVDPQRDRCNFYGMHGKLP